jgi:hypothetical protein
MGSFISQSNVGPKIRVGDPILKFPTFYPPIFYPPTSPKCECEDQSILNFYWRNSGQKEKFKILKKSDAILKIFDCQFLF